MDDAEFGIGAVHLQQPSRYGLFLTSLGSRHVAPCGFFKQEVEVTSGPLSVGSDGRLGENSPAHVAVFLEHPGEFRFRYVELFAQTYAR